MKRSESTPSLALLAALLASLPIAQAAQFSVHLVVDNGPSIDGIVDTLADTFTINSWTDASATPRLRVPMPSQLPLPLRAFDAAGSLYDIPDAWNGNIGQNAGWAFLLPIGQDLTTVQWIQGQPTSYWQGASFGWGALRNTGGGVVLKPFNTLSYVPKADTTALSDAPIRQVTVTRVPRLTITRELNTVRLSWDSETNRLYQVQYRSELVAGVWADLGSSVANINGAASSSDSTVGNERRFYRLVVLP
jgi:hypothetical protein